ncbi:MAG: MBL fold metallo-hydrolase, partial [Bacteroidaceae bacterium]|nr:MBL fold metallo-hydrolase [Bacteroidaceae bacterium]
CHYHTCHCTGVEAFQRLRAALGERITYTGVGSLITW